MLTLTRVEIAEHQLERALQLFLDEKDYVCAITLAGASEEILGKLLEKEGKEHALGSFITACVATGKVVYNENWSQKLFADMANSFRNDLKHYTNERSVTIPREAAVEILDRAIENFWALASRETPNMRRFMEEAHGV
ncbi:MAG: hypothetical protein HY067_05065 [Betaproteobacteria bacterium]|nr:hypothetical protein [Betaproteobacteria bacterium]